MEEKPFKSILYTTSADGRTAFITLNRPAQLNAIDEHMPHEIRAAVRRANEDDGVHCIVVRGSGAGFCGGYDLRAFAERGRDATGGGGGSQDPRDAGYDALEDYRVMGEYTACFASLFHSRKPTVAQVHGAAVAGGSDVALSCDLAVVADDARIGYPPSRVWGCPTTAMWAARVGAERAKRMLFTGDLVSGKEAEAMGLVLKAVPPARLEETTRLLVDRIKSVPVSQLWMCKQVVNSFVEGQIASAQRLASVFDGIARNSPEGLAFQRMAQTKGFKEAVAARDGPGRTEEYRRRWKSVL